MPEHLYPSPIQLFPFSISDSLHGCCDTIKNSLKTQWAIYDSFLMKTCCSSETGHSWMFLGQEAKRREDGSLFKFTQKFRRNVPIVPDTFFWPMAYEFYGIWILSMGILWKRLCHFNYCIVAATVSRTILRLWTLDMEKYGWKALTSTSLDCSLKLVCPSGTFLLAGNASWGISQENESWWGGTA